MRRIEALEARIAKLERDASEHWGINYEFGVPCGCGDYQPGAVPVFGYRIKGLLAQWKQHHGPKRPRLSKGDLQHAKNYCAVELEAALRMDGALAEGPESSTLVEKKAVQPAGERVSPEFIAGRLFEAKLIVENYLDLGGWELVSKDDFGEHIDYLERAALAAPTSTGESHDTPQGGQQHD